MNISENEIEECLISDEDNLDDDWDNFLAGTYDETSLLEINSKDIEKIQCSDLYISTKTIISFLNKEINLKDLFWKIPIEDYHKTDSNILKKEMKFICLSKEETDSIYNELKNYRCYNDYVMTNIINPNARIKYKVVRKISVGISKKDILNFRSKQKGAFYNCFVLILRIFDDNIYKEIHIKIFNTGKLEIPGITTNELLIKTLEKLIFVLKPFLGEDLTYDLNQNKTVLVNSNFNCGHYIKREILFDILQKKYNIRCIYDPCSYPGIQCKYKINKNLFEKETEILEVDEFYNLSNIKKNYKSLLKKISDNKETSLTKEELTIAYNRLVNNYGDNKEIAFMIFRTGSVLIVGKCDDEQLYKIYNYIKNILINEREQIFENFKDEIKEKKITNRKRKIIIKKITT